MNARWQFGWGSRWQTPIVRALGFAVVVGAGVLTIIASSGGSGALPALDSGQWGVHRVTNPPPTDNPPTAFAGPDQTVAEGQFVTLEGGGWDAEGMVSYGWRQMSGPSVNLSNSGRPRPTFVAPPVAQRTELEFRLRVFDSKGQVGSNGIAYTSVFVEPSSQPPVFKVLDFETLPDGSVPVEYEPVNDDYLAECSIFRNADLADVSRPPEYRRFEPLNTLVWDNDRVFNPPPETTFNVTIEFTVPVASISADVFVEPGSSVTLVAFDELGTELGSVTSDVSTECCTAKAGTIALADLGWIYLVTFESSAPQTDAPAIDNLLLERRMVCN